MSTPITFEDLPLNTVLTEQYASEDIHFKPAKIDWDKLTPFMPQVLSAPLFSETDLPKYIIDASFAADWHSIVQEVFLQSGPGYQQVELVSDTNIARFRVHSYALFAIDNLAFDDLTRGRQPDFRVLYAGGSLMLKPGGWGTVQLTVVRLNGSYGPIRVDSWNGLNLEVSPGAVILDPYTDPNTRTIGMSFIADGSISDFIQNKKVTATFVPEAATAGTEPRSVTVPITVMEQYDAYIAGMEVTQGVQNLNLPHKSDYLSEEAVQYDGVRLADGGTTRVRIFCAATISSPSYRGVPLFDCVLHGFTTSSGQELPGSPITSLTGVPPIPGSGVTVNTIDRGIREGPSTDFILPAAWTTGTINLRAELRIPFSFVPSEVYDIHPQNNVFTMTSIPFYKMNPVYVSPVWLHIDPVGTITFPRVATSTVFAEARNLLLDGDNQFFCSNYYSKSIDITDIFSDTENSTDKGNSIAVRLQDSADDWEIIHFNVATVGVYSGDGGSVIWPTTNGRKEPSFSSNSIPRVSVVQSYGRPLSSVAHEIGHLLGRKHASGFNNASDLEPWPNTCGLIDSVGVDRRNGAVFFPTDSCGITKGYYYYMSYNFEPLIWTSAKGWEEGLTHQISTADSGAVQSATRLQLLNNVEVHDRLISGIVYIVFTAVIAYISWFIIHSCT